MSTNCNTICWNPSDVYLALIGGCLIGLATSLHYLLMGRVTGFSGIYYSLVTLDKGSWNWKLGLMSSVMLASCIMFKIYDNGQTPLMGSTPSYNPESLLTGIGWAGCVISGFLVGFGTKMGNGCTSGHGVCGLPRLSMRSFIAVICFMGMGFITATFRYYVIGDDYSAPTNQFQYPQDYTIISTIFLCISIALIILAFILQMIQDKSKLIDVSVGSLTGFIFGLGLVVSGMVQRYKIISFLTISHIWDPSLAFVMISAVGINFITFRLMDKPVFNIKFEIPTNKTVDLKLILGGLIFGMGWGIGGLCPGPAFALYPEFTIQIGVLFMFFLAIGQITANIIVEKTKEIEIMSKPLL